MCNKYYALTEAKVISLNSKEVSFNAFVKMKLSSCFSITRFTQTFCLIGAITTTGWCVYNYMLNEDVCLVDFRNLYENNYSSLPTISLCLLNPLLEAPGRPGTLLGFDIDISALPSICPSGIHLPYTPPFQYLLQLQL